MKICHNIQFGLLIPEKSEIFRNADWLRMRNVNFLKTLLCNVAKVDHSDHRSNWNSLNIFEITVKTARRQIVNR